MHYNTGRVRNGYIVKPGPLLRNATLESVDAPGSFVDVDLDLREYEGEWFDSNDVEGYLMEKGLQIDPQSSFVEGLITIPASNLLTESASPPAMFNSPHASASEMSLSPASSPTPILSETALELGTQRLFPELGTNSPNELWDSAATGWLMGSGDKTPDFLSSGWLGVSQPSSWELGDAVGANDTFMDYGASHLKEPEAPPRVEPKKNVTIDVSKLIDGEFNFLPAFCRTTTNFAIAELIKSGICLGRAPGFRKADVDRALSSSIIQVF